MAVRIRLIDAVAFVISCCILFWFRMKRTDLITRHLVPKMAREKCGLITFSAVVILFVSVGLAMWFVHSVLSLEVPYLMIPVFGALGGFAGSILRNENHLALVRFDRLEYRLRLGFVGDMVLGLAGSAATVFLLGSTLNFKAEDTKTYPLMVSISLISGVFGQLMIERAGKELAQVKRDTKGLQQETKGLQEETKKLRSSSASSLVTTSMYQYDQDDFDGALRAAEAALKLDPTNLVATVARARALKRLGRVAEALAITQERMEKPEEGDTDRQRAALIYNLVCYRLLLSTIPHEEAIELLRQVMDLDMSLRQTAPKDKDLEILWTNPEFKRLTSWSSESAQ